MLGLLAESTEVTHELPHSIWFYGGGVLFLLLLALYCVTRFDPDR